MRASSAVLTVVARHWYLELGGIRDRANTKTAPDLKNELKLWLEKVRGDKATPVNFADSEQLRECVSYGFISQNF